MRNRWIRRRLLVLIFTFFIILYVDFQLQTSSIPKLTVVHHPSTGALHHRSIQQDASSAKDAQNPTKNTRSSGETIFAHGNEGHSVPEVAHVSRPKLKLEDIYIAVKTTGRFHRTRLALLLETWISRTKAHTFIFTDTEDADLSSEGYNMVVTGCQSDHSQQALSCKMSAEYDGFMASNKRWFCHVDDDNYVNPEALLSLLSAFTQEGDIYVGKPSLDKPITAHELLEGNRTPPLNSKTKLKCVPIGFVSKRTRVRLTAAIQNPYHPFFFVIFTLHCWRDSLRIFECAWEFAHPVYMCFVDLEKAFDRVPRGILREVLWEYGVSGPLLWVIQSLYNCSECLVRIDGNKSDSFPREVRFWFATGGAGFCLSRRLAEKMSPWASGSQFVKTSAKIRLPDDCTVGFIVEKRLGISMVHCPLFHSHLENLLLISQRSIPQQVTLSYGIFENKMNSIEVKGSFSKEDDPSRFKTVHCMLYPLTSWCP